MNARDLAQVLHQRWPNSVLQEDHERLRLEIEAVDLVEATQWLQAQSAWFGGIVAESLPPGTALSYPFLPSEGPPWLVLRVRVDGVSIPSIAEICFAADWQEREVEDLFGLRFSGHPQLGDFVLHDERWPEDVAPMRRAFDAQATAPRQTNPPTRPQPVLHADGAFTMNVGPVYSDIAESAQFQLETVGEEIVSMRPRFFYKYRGLEKIAEGQEAWRSVLLAERLNGTSAVAHALACTTALETISHCEPPPRACRLRVIAAELERLRSHTATIAAICKSTGLSVPTNHAYALLESLLRLSGECFGHRYLFGLIVPGGTSLDVADATLRSLVTRAAASATALAQLGDDLSFDNSFLDRIEEVGIITAEEATRYGLVGPVGRASNRRGFDLRLRAPYADYAAFAPNECIEGEGDGYARLRVFLAEAAEAARLLDCVAEALPAGPVRAPWCAGAGTALGWSEAPAGAAVHWLRVDETGHVARWRILPPAFVNWHAFHLAAEHFAFQDFPITLATVGLSLAETDR